MLINYKIHQLVDKLHYWGEIDELGFCWLWYGCGFFFVSLGIWWF
jgi:hypothetical protein